MSLRFLVSLSSALACLASAAASEPMLDRPVPDRLTGRDFVSALERQVSASWENIEFRVILNRLAESQKTAVILDRGIDSNRVLDLNLGYQRLYTGFETVAQAGSAEICIVGNTIYVGPKVRVQKLRSLEHLRANELEVSLKSRAKSLSRKKTVHWNDLDEPRQIAVDLAGDWGVTIINPEAIPHDLWASASLPDATFTEALSLILIQFDLTFAWSTDGTRIQVRPVPDKVSIERAYTPAGGPSPRASRGAKERFLKNAAAAYEQQHQGLTAKVDLDNNRLLLSGTLEQHEAITGEGPLTAKAASPASNSPPLEKRAFTLRDKSVRVIDLMKTLEATDIEFVYDKALFASKQIDLEQIVNMNIKQTDADEFFKAMFDPVGVKFRYKNHTVTLEPK